MSRLEGTRFVVHAEPVCDAGHSFLRVSHDVLVTHPQRWLLGERKKELGGQVASVPLHCTHQVRLPCHRLAWLEHLLCGPRVSNGAWIPDQLEISHIELRHPAEEIAVRWVLRRIEDDPAIRDVPNRRVERAEDLPIAAQSAELPVSKHGYPCEREVLDAEALRERGHFLRIDRPRQVIGAFQDLSPDVTLRECCTAATEIILHHSAMPDFAKLTHGGDAVELTEYVVQNRASAAPSAGHEEHAYWIRSHDRVSAEVELFRNRLTARRIHIWSLSRGYNSRNAALRRGFATNTCASGPTTTRPPKPSLNDVTD